MTPIARVLGAIWRAFLLLVSVAILVSWLKSYVAPDEVTGYSHNEESLVAWNVHAVNGLFAIWRVVYDLNPTSVAPEVKGRWATTKEEYKSLRGVVYGPSMTMQSPTWWSALVTFALRTGEQPFKGDGYHPSKRWVVVTVPHWSLLLIFGFLPGRSLIRAAVKRSCSARALCAHCGYDLRASKDRCPECGTEIPPPPSPTGSSSSP